MTRERDDAENATWETMMVKVCRVPPFAKGIFSANELSGWQDGIAYSPSEIRERKKELLAKRRAERLAAIPVLEPPEVERLDIGFVF